MRFTAVINPIEGAACGWAFIPGWVSYREHISRVAEVCCGACGDAVGVTGAFPYEPVYLVDDMVDGKRNGFYTRVSHRRNRPLPESIQGNMLVSLIPTGAGYVYPYIVSRRDFRGFACPSCKATNEVMLPWHMPGRDN